MSVPTFAALGTPPHLIQPGARIRFRMPMSDRFCDGRILTVDPDGAHITVEETESGADYVIDDPVRSYEVLCVYRPHKTRRQVEEFEARYPLHLRAAYDDIAPCDYVNPGMRR